MRAFVICYVTAMLMAACYKPTTTEIPTTITCAVDQSDGDVTLIVCPGELIEGQDVLVTP